jgi:hypothetical protein
MQKNTLNQGHYAIPWPIKKFPALYGKRINTTKGRRMIQAEIHKDANKRKTDITRQTGTCGITAERMYNCVMCYITILM